MRSASGRPRRASPVPGGDRGDSVGFDLGFGRGTFEKVNWSQPRPVVGERELDELAELAELATRGLDVEALLGVRGSTGEVDGDSDGDSEGDSDGRSPVRGADRWASW